MSHTKLVSTNAPYAAPATGIVAAGLTGAIITGATTAAREIRKVKSGELDRAEAMSTVTKEAIGGGLAVATGAAVGKLLFRSSLLGAITMVAVSVGVTYALDGMKNKKETVPAKVKKAAPAKAEPVAPKSAKKERK